VEIVERRIVVDLDRVLARRNPVELIDQSAVGVAHLDRVIVVDLGGQHREWRWP
jgi:hypothetical protein